ncbi:aldo/keto reductase [Streptomyces sp. S1D4-20]|uniref:aldo/keto reductase n=1 Tax=Streptomyces sp. S1D4-20 TaxID=2594462 RepID=UPI0011624557|nr:aldo/keto reductase [Streptomyces sp. S1D4-20]QDN54252.1 aldo/keto reductase [Streptomyces sp. S1D4-20]
MAAYDLSPRHLGRGLIVHPLGVTTGAIGKASGKREPAPAERHRDEGGFHDGLQRAVDHGATLVDTADSYGNGYAECVIGRFMEDRPDLTLQLSSKVGQVPGSAPHPFAGRHIHHQLEQSLDNLYVDQLGLYTLDSYDFGLNDVYLKDAIKLMRTLQELEYIKAIGLRGPYVDYTASPRERTAQAERFLHLFREVEPDVVWTPFNALTPALLLDGEDLFSFTARHGVGLVLAASLKHGQLTDEALKAAPERPSGWTEITDLIPQFMQRGSARLRALRDHSGDDTDTLERLVLRSCLQRRENCAVVVDVDTTEQVDENYACLSARLTDQALALVDEIYLGLRTGLEPAVVRRSVQGMRV